MNNHSKGLKGSAARAIASAVLLCAVAGAWPAAAQNRDLDSAGADRRYYGQHLYDGGLPDDGF